MKFETAVKKAHNYGSMLILSIKANGGYKFRSLLKLSDKEVQDACRTCEDAVRDLVVRITVAELMLQEKPPSYHSRWGEYHQRLKDAKNILAVGQANKSKGRKTA